MEYQGRETKCYEEAEGKKLNQLEEVLQRIDREVQVRAWMAGKWKSVKDMWMSIMDT
jgi:thymidylate synthase